MNENYNSNISEALDWDSVIEKESDFVLLPKGTYDFTVTGFERGYHNGSEKLAACPKAELTLSIDSPEGTATIKHNLFVSRKTEGLLCAFFISIGQKKHGEPLKMNWNQVIGSRGRCEVGIRTYNGNEYNEIKKFLKPENAATQPSSGFTPGKF